MLVGMINQAPVGALTLCVIMVDEIIALLDMLSIWRRWGEIRCLGFSGGGLQTLYAAAINNE